ncbi:hypothetical protein GCM10011529_30620 [Polymorphobacter glacialis]|uniref:SIR2-like domain-containing protein n=1 Tax=Sandarakinorhabdus glacialis TaxID=1614636 RepID=A0A917A128_9SPHN|nr:hypothetical protein [Polymorphobacter glacialis]GGE21873.1 hypothetical protein GCM10011529_30620 [Polymorphobacter glacialis]
MFNSKTVLVLGAGASYEVGLPVGEQLLKAICSLLDVKFERSSQQTHGDRMIIDALKQILNEGRDVTRLNEHIRKGLQIISSAVQAISIDNIIDALEDEQVELVGKLAIARSIHSAERASKHFAVTENDPNAAPPLGMFFDTWYDSFTKILTENVKISQLDRMFENVQIVSFNYDRCIEQYLPYSIANYYGLKHYELHSAVSNLIIHRPYGIVGDLPWKSGDGKGVPFGGGTIDDLISSASQVRTFTEQVKDRAELNDIHEALKWADKIVFLGFGYNQQNMALLATDIGAPKKIVGTAHKISNDNCMVIKDEIFSNFNIQDPNHQFNFKIVPSECRTLFNDLSRLISS